MITIEPIIYTIRVGIDNNKFGDPYASVCTATKISSDTIRVTAFAGGFTMNQSMLLWRMLKELGFKYVVWERVKNGQYSELRREL